MPEENNYKADFSRGTLATLDPNRVAVGHLRFQPTDAVGGGELYVAMLDPSTGLHVWTLVSVSGSGSGAVVLGTWSVQQPVGAGVATALFWGALSAGPAGAPAPVTGQITAVLVGAAPPPSATVSVELNVGGENTIIGPLPGALPALMAVAPPIAVTAGTEIQVNVINGATPLAEPVNVTAALLIQAT